MERPRVLVVDDEADIRQLMAEALADEGYHVEQAGDGREAVAMTERTVPDAVLLDLDMPILDGPGFMRAMADRGIIVPIILVSAATDLAARSAALGTTRYLPKPFDILDLLKTIASVLSGR